ncbi:putative lipoprotein [Leptospira broomii serovar Hurstbridge str. 5399]|uniref:Lipoprotein n=1 Tax=Leptospira broomii serovar Hurstbridge str. 5399 TaxID=1049789 RepID=T0GLC6_9LEPT|nr:hypothetical protein [Leptospira broomii]EQA46163.1 putative lipoprotein [Leptospira broomii serovar Hurstbridge str. 5399]
MKITSITIKAAIILITLSGCFFDEKKNNDNDTTLTSLLYVANITPTPSGTWFFYNATPTYAGQTNPYPLDAGTIKEGTYIINSSQVIVTYNGFSASKMNVKLVDNSRSVVFGQVTADAQFGANQYLYYMWTFSGGYYYVCPDLNSYKNTLQDVVTDFNNLTTTQVDRTNLVSGCFGAVWSRLQVN